MCRTVYHTQEAHLGMNSKACHTDPLLSFPETGTSYRASVGVCLHDPVPLHDAHLTGVQADQLNAWSAVRPIVVEHAHNAIGADTGVQADGRRPSICHHSGAD